jgi:hypothetical protein
MTTSLRGFEPLVETVVVDNPVRQAFRLINGIRSGTFKINGRSTPVANDRIPVSRIASAT